MSQKTYVPSEDELDREWVVFDADGVVLGRLATRVARILQGKHKPKFTPHLDCGDAAIVINAAGVRLTGKKESQEGLVTHSQFPGGLKERSYEDVMEENPERIVKWAVGGMLPKNKLRDRMMKHLRIYAGPEHEHQAQQPVDYDWEKDRIVH